MADKGMKKRWISLYVENQVGVLSKISGLFSGKSYNLDSLNCSSEDKVELFQIAETFKARVIDYGKDSLLLEFVQTATKNDAVVKLIKEEFGRIEVVRGGSVGIESISMMER